MNNITIGELVKREVDRQKLSASQFADLLCYKRNNAYNIFKATYLDTSVLGKISKVLGHNFFEDIAHNMALSGMEDPQAIEEIKNKTNVSQFMSCVPKIIKGLGMQSHIALGETFEINGSPVLPDFLMYPQNITFTIGCSLEEKMKKYVLENDPSANESTMFNNVIRFDHIKSNDGKNEVLLVTNEFSNMHTIDITIDYKTESEWKDMILFACDVVDRYFSAKDFMM